MVRFFADPLDLIWIGCFFVSLVMHFLLVWLWTLLNLRVWILFQLLFVLFMTVPENYYMNIVSKAFLCYAFLISECALRIILYVWMFYHRFVSILVIQSWSESLLFWNTSFQLLILTPTYLVDAWLWRYWKKGMSRIKRIEDVVNIQGAREIQSFYHLPNDLHNLILNYCGELHSLLVVYSFWGKDIFLTPTCLLEQQKGCVIEYGRPPRIRIRFIAYLIFMFPFLARLLRRHMSTIQML